MERLSGIYEIASRFHRAGCGRPRRFGPERHGRQYERRQIGSVPHGVHPFVAILAPSTAMSSVLVLWAAWHRSLLSVRTRDFPPVIHIAHHRAFWQITLCQIHVQSPAASGLLLNTTAVYSAWGRSLCCGK